MSGYILAIDQGTTSSRCMIFDKNGEVVSSAQHAFPQHFPQPGWVEQDPWDIWNTVVLSMRDACRVGKIQQGDISVIGITNQRETTIVWDAKTGEPVYPAIVWQCRRTAAMCDQIKEAGFADEILEKTGLVVDAYFSATKIRYVLEQIPGAVDRAEKGELLFGTVDSWLIWNLTGNAVHATDYSNASRTMLFDINQLCWDKKLCQIFGIPMEMLPEARSTCEGFGYVTNEIQGIESLSGVQILAVAGDQAAALFGQQCFDEGDTKNTYGTGCFALMNTGNRRIHTRSGLVTSVAWSIGDKAVYALEGSVFNAGTAITWLIDEMKMITKPSECDELASRISDNEGVYFVPAFTGLGAPYWDMYARGTILGLTRGSGRSHFARAVLESIAYQVRDLVMTMQTESGFTITELKVDGGASRSNLLMQFQSDILFTDVNRGRETESTAQGIAFLAGLGAGIFSSLEEIKKIRKVDRLFSPQMEEKEVQKICSEWKRAVIRAEKWIESE